MVYLNNILIFLKTLKEYKVYIIKVLEKLEEKDLLVKLIKCEFYKETITFLRYKITYNQIRSDPNKVRVILD